PEIAEEKISYGGQEGEFDDAWVYQNVIVLAEYTTSQSSDVTSHVKNKKIIFDNITNDPLGFVRYLCTRFPVFSERISSAFHISKFILRIIYCSRYDFDSNIKGIVNNITYLDYPLLRYFEKIT